jgi:tetratricopeptide (TPR) repeat protein
MLELRDLNLKLSPSVMFKACDSRAQKKWQSPAIPSGCLYLFFLVCLPLPAASQNNSLPIERAVPPELTAIDPDIRALLSDEYIPCKSRNPNERIEKIQKALQIANDRGLIRDKAVAEAVMASAFVGEANMETAFLAYEKAFQDSIDSKNEILEADILNALASQAELKGNNQKALELLSRALGLSERNGSLYEKARTLGAMGRLQLLAGKTDEARNSIEQALNIDKLVLHENS